MQLTQEQENRLQAVVRSGAYPSAAEALDAALDSVEVASSPDFEGEAEELDALLQKGLASPVLSEQEFWLSFARS